MMKNKLICLMLTVCLCAALFAGCAQKPSDVKDASGADTTVYSPKQLSEGDAAPDFTATLTTGETFTLSDHKDEAVLLNFWATWCPPCVGELPVLEQLVNEGIKDFSLIAVNCSEWKDTVDSFLAKNGYTFNVAYDESGEIGRLYPTEGIPYTLIIYKGTIRNIFLGVPSTPYETYKNAVTACFGE